MKIIVILKIGTPSIAPQAGSFAAPTSPVGLDSNLKLLLLYKSALSVPGRSHGGTYVLMMLRAAVL